MAKEIEKMTAFLNFYFDLVSEPAWQFSKYLESANLMVEGYKR